MKARLLVGGLFLMYTGQVAAQSVGHAIALDGPPAPVAPAVIARDALTGRATIRAVPLSRPLRIDGQLDEVVYADVPPVSDFVQIEPLPGAPATEKTDVWVTFDRHALYVSARCWETHPEQLMANEMRRDNTGIFQGSDHLAFMLDTFYDRRNGVMFVVTPSGGRADGQFTNERQYSGDWNPVWDVKTARFEGGWTVEAAIPFKSLRYRPGVAQVWGFNVRRRNRWKNEVSLITPIPVARTWNSSVMAASLAPTLVGIEAPAGSRNLELKPYVTSNLLSDSTVTPKRSNELDADVGMDLKYGVTQNVTADFTYNTDFAQVEADEQQINLTRFSLFFPEKREFFLENQGIFAFAGATASGSGDTPVLFYSRRIGLAGGRAVPIQAGGRLTGRLGRFTLGLLNIESNNEPVSRSVATNFSVVRVRRELLRRSSIGAMFTHRSVGQTGVGTNDAYGLDARFAFYDNLAIDGYWARTRTDGLSGEDTSYLAHVDYAGDRYGVQLERLAVGDHFNPDVGFVRRDDMRRTFGQFRFSPRMLASKVVRKYSSIGSLLYIEDGRGQLQTREQIGAFEVEFQSSDRFGVTFTDTHEFLPQPFRIASVVTLPAGSYDFANVRTNFDLGLQRKASGSLSVEYGTFYSGHKAALGVSRGRVNIRSQLSVEPTYSVNWVTLAEGAFTTQLFGSRVTYSVTPRMFTSALLQYASDSHTVSANVRLRWEYRPGSELFVVLDERRDTLGVRFPMLTNRAIILKINRLIRF